VLKLIWFFIFIIRQSVIAWCEKSKNNCIEISSSERIKCGELRISDIKFINIYIVPVFLGVGRGTLLYIQIAP
jgi:hypothetical protein